MSTGYHIYSNTGARDPINYTSPVATIGSPATTTWSSSALTHPGTWSFGVRAFDTVSGLEEENLDCSVTIVLDASGQDITNQPPAPVGLRAFATAGGAIRVEWISPPTSAVQQPQGFFIYFGTGGTPNYASPAATVLFTAATANTFATNLAGLTDGTTYTIGVRAYNATAEEANTNTVTVTADATGPTAVVSLTAVATS
jgi:Fibronectin type III domain